MKFDNPRFQKLAQRNRKEARLRWPSLLRKVNLSTLNDLSNQFGFSVSMGELLLLDGRWYVTHTGLIRLARTNRCAGIHVRPVPEFSDALNRRYAFKATVHTSGQGPGFVGYGDADPSNVSDLVRGAEMRVAETRAVNRLCARRTASAFARSRRSDRLRRHRKLRRKENCPRTQAPEMATEAIPCATGCAKSFVGISSTPTW
jgi:hypothetical protein